MLRRKSKRGDNIKEKFINSIEAAAIQGYKKYNILPSLTIAQAILETGWGKSSIGNNLFGIKANSSWKGKKQLVKTHEYINGEKVYIETYFRDYDSIADSLEDRFKLLSSSRYSKVVQARDYKEVANEIYKAGYATDPEYPNKLIQIIEQNKLYEFDDIAKEGEDMKVYINDRKVDLNVNTKEGISYVKFKGMYIPLRDLFEELGFKVEWEESTKSIKISNENKNNASQDSNVDTRIKKLGLENVKELQEIFGLAVDGIVGKNTLSLLDKLDNVKHFKLDEFRCKHCKELKLDIDLLLKLEELRLKTGPLIINSGYRCPTHNKNVGGATNSQHLKGTAADIRGTKMNPNEVYNHADKIFSDGGVGRYNTFTHVDVRNSRSRWNG